MFDWNHLECIIWYKNTRNNSNWFGFENSMSSVSNTSIYENHASFKQNWHFQESEKNECTISQRRHISIQMFRSYAMNDSKSFSRKCKRLNLTVQGQEAD